ncbi:alpha-hydroxyketone-type quorum-sensing autoinducer synthase [Nocardia terpenica]|uniref:alpha-hydroxyketone-type quorum-sensing autoinducer synthase n=1 Tax=Nocardia terpenica TaxID=455432 RepID=UPI00142DFF8E|nr:alpha-hydroxyketone-type quorum-sensing autoinducer synthase [Nocardia terpenica]
MIRSAGAVAARLQDRIDHFHRDRVAGEWGHRHILHGRDPGPGSVLVNSNDYLALSGHPRIAAAMTDALTHRGAIASGAFVHGEHPQLRLERALARHLRAPGGIVCQSGWDANVGLLQSISDQHTPVYIDYIAHMSLWSGARAAGAPVHPFRHNSPSHLREQIALHGPGVIAVDSIYSTNGSRCPLATLCEIAEDTGSLLVVDESHSLGTDGPAGAGVVVDQELTARVHFRTASLSKAFAGRAGFVTAVSPEFVDYFKMESYPAVFSSGMLPHDIAGLATTLDIVRSDDRRRRRLREVSSTIRTALRDLGFDLENSDSHIVPLLTGPDHRAIAVRDFLEERGIFGSVFCPPATSRHRTLIRLSLHAALTDADVDRIIQACTEVRDTFGVIPAKSMPE